MTTAILSAKLDSLPPTLLEEVDNYIEFLKSKQRKIKPLKERKFGSHKGFFEMKADFDDPIDDFKEYM